MDDLGWSRCGELWERLKWARLHSPSKMTTKAAGAVISKNEQTYRTYERPSGPTGRTINAQDVITLGRRWKISWQWILSGEGTPFDRELTPRQLKLITLLDQASEDLQDAAYRALEGMLDERKAG